MTHSFQDQLWKMWSLVECHLSCSPGTPCCPQIPRFQLGTVLGTLETVSHYICIRDKQIHKLGQQSFVCLKFLYLHTEANSLPIKVFTLSKPLYGKSNPLGDLCPYKVDEGHSVNKARGFQRCMAFVQKISRPAGFKFDWKLIPKITLTAPEKKEQNESLPGAVWCSKARQMSVVNNL